MADAVSYQDGIGRKEIQTIRRRYGALHRDRLRNISNELRQPQRRFLELLPLLFHINHPMLPGFVGTNAPMGLPDYSPSQAVLRTAKGLSRSFKYKARAQLSYRIHALYLMGSIGSIAHTHGSDFDIWLCHDPELDQEQRLQLHQKAEKIEQWAAELSLEVHFFIMDADAFRNGTRDALSHESSGDTQPHFLLEEFYRTAVLVAGRYPIWWLVPPEQEDNYDAYVHRLTSQRFIDPMECLNFGGLNRLPVDEFLGAAHWQLYKGVESPYKTILKLLLTESYAQDYPNIRWLCQEAKKAIYSGEFELTQLDPYVLMYKRVEQYLMGRNEPKRLALARRCLYFKVGLSLSQHRAVRYPSWKQELMLKMTRDWGWERTHLSHLDTRQRWKIDQVMKERNTLVHELTHSYRLLTNFAQEYASVEGINPAEISLLGRKLYTALEKRPGKIDHINPGISLNLQEERVSLHHARSHGERYVWQLYLGDIDEPAAKDQRPLKTTQCLIEMLAWCHINQVLGQTSHIAMFPKDNPVRQTELRSLLHTLETLYIPNSQIHNTPIKQLAESPYARSCALFINTGVDPMARLAKKGKQLTTERSDPLSFSASHNSLIVTIEQITTTSWGETLVQQYRGTQGLLETLCNFLRLTQLHKPPTTTHASVHSFSSVRGASIAHRVETLFKDVAISFNQAGTGPDSRYLVQIDDAFYLIQKQQDHFSFSSSMDREQLFAALSRPQSCYRHVSIDSQTLADTPLSTLYSYNRPDVIQVFFFSKKGLTDLYVLDEQGALFLQQMQTVDEHYLLVQQQRFLSGIRLLRNMVNEAPAHRLLLDAPEFYRLSLEPDGQYRVESRTPPQTRVPNSYQELRLVSDGLETRNAPYMFSCGDEEFSSIDYGDKLYKAVASHILEQRQNKKNYPIYLTTLELSNIVPDSQIPTIELLKFKRYIEAQLNQSLNTLIAG